MRLLAPLAGPEKCDVLGSHPIRRSSIAQMQSVGFPGTDRPDRGALAYCAFTGDFGSSRSAIRSLICPGVSRPAWPKRGMPEQAL